MCVFEKVTLILSIGFLAASAFFPALCLERPRRTAILISLSLMILSLPFFIPAEAILARCSGVLMALLVFKMYDVHVAADKGLRPDLRTYLLFLPNVFSCVLRKLEAEPHPPLRYNLFKLARGIAGFAICAVIVVGMFRVNWHPFPFIAEHSVKTLAIYLTGVNFLAMIATLWRLAGGKTRDPFDSPYLAITPADFWRRHNRPVQQFFYENVFRPVGGLRSPVRGTLLSFAVSAILHEYAFGVAFGGVIGYQTAFFMMQGCAVVATMRLKPKGWKAVFWWALTLAFNLVSSVLFAANASHVIPFYSRSLPTWFYSW